MKISIQSNDMTQDREWSTSIMVPLPALVSAR